MNQHVELNLKGLEQLEKAFKTLPTVRVGILGRTDARNTGEANSNASVGLRHEFGTEELPMRSFLRMPITEKMKDYLEKSGAFTKETLARVVEEGSIEAWMEKVGVTAERVVADAFASGGFGKWQPSNMDHKKVHQTLVESGQLQRAITSEVK